MTVVLAMLGLMALSCGAMLLGWKSCDWWPKGSCETHRASCETHDRPETRQDTEGHDATR